jgi:hypothetical protein
MTTTISCSADTPETISSTKIRKVVYDDKDVSFLLIILFCAADHENSVSSAYAVHIMGIGVCLDSSVEG